jgi:60 kDa SS-A/Ro ribonucleoprotein
MARSNRPPEQPQVQTHEGAPASVVGAEASLRRSVMACLLWEGTFYEDGVEVGSRILELAAHPSAIAPERVAALAVEARTQMKLRHAPLLLARALASRRWAGLATLLPQVIQRADELAEFVSLYWATAVEGGLRPAGRQPLTAAAKRGLAQAFCKFDAYGLAKYNRPDAVKLRDVLFLVHAKPKDAAQAATWKLLVEKSLPAPDTWEVALSGGADKKATWERLLAEKKLGALALLRNLRNMMEVGVPRAAMATALAEMKVDRVLPFRFITAARMVPQWEPELEQAMFRAAAGLPKLPGRTAIVVDNSGSMDGPISGKTVVTRKDAAAGVAILAREICEQATVISFGDHPVLVPSRRGFALRDAIQQANTGGSTMTEQAKQMADAQGYERIVIITDEQSHEALSAPKAPGYVVNVAPYQYGVGYGKWLHIDGWSEAVLGYIMALEGYGVPVAADVEEVETAVAATAVA